MKTKSKKLNLPMSIALVAGTMIGSGIFLLPAALANYGGISLFGWIFTTVGAILLALSLSRLSRIIPKSGGPYAYTTEAFGELNGFLVGWGYWIAVLVGQAAVAVAAVGYLGVFDESFTSSPITSAIIACSLLWLLVFINIKGVRESGKLQFAATILKILPIVLVIFLGLYFWNFENFIPFNVSEESTFGAITTTAIMTLWAFLGIESATVAAENVENPEVNVAKATIIGTSIAAVIYTLGSMAVLAIIPLDELSASTAPFADAANLMLGKSAKYVVAIGAIISCLGALNGMIMTSSQMPFALSRDGLFGKKFKNLNSRGTPQWSILLGGIVVTIFTFLNYSKGLVDLFTFLILLSTLSMLLPLAFATMSELMLLLRNEKSIPIKTRNKTIVLGSLAFCYVIWMIIGAGKDVVYWGFLLFLLGMPFYVLFKWMNREERPQP